MTTFFNRFMTSLVTSINISSYCVMCHHKNGYSRNSKILGTWTLDLLRSSRQMIMLLSSQVCAYIVICLLLFSESIKVLVEVIMH